MLVHSPIENFMKVKNTLNLALQIKFFMRTVLALFIHA